MAVFSANNISGVLAISSSNASIAHGHKIEPRPIFSVGIEPATSESKRKGYRGMAKVGKACGRCRLKKCKCDGSHPCQRCYKDNAICNTTKRRPVPERTLNNEEIKVLLTEHGQLTEGLQHLYRCTQNGQGWEGLPVEGDESGQPLIHLILERLGVVKAKTTTRSANAKGKACLGEKRILEQHKPAYNKIQIEALETPVHRFPLPGWKPEFLFSDLSYEVYQPLEDVFGWNIRSAERFYLTSPLEGEELFRT